jgi:hypothetical protein
MKFGVVFSAAAALVAAPHERADRGYVCGLGELGMFGGHLMRLTRSYTWIGCMMSNALTCPASWIGALASYYR